MAFTTTVGAGGTSLIGPSGVDTTSIAGTNLVSGVYIAAEGSGDVVNVITSPASNFTVYMGSGNDTFNAAVALTGTSVKLGEEVDNATVVNITNSTISGLNGVDTITANGSVTSSLINGNNGNDVLNFGDGGAADAYASATLVGGQGDDAITLNLAGSVAGTKINGQDGDDTITGAVTGAFANSSTVFGGQGNDVITLGTVANGVIISGDLGNDTLSTLGVAGAVTIYGGDGADSLTGGTVGDTLSGGAGVDSFGLAASGTWNGGGAAQAINATQARAAAAAFDVVTDFNAGVGGDRISVGAAAQGTIAANGIITNGGTIAAAGTSRVYSISGTYTASTGAWATAATSTAGADTLIIAGDLGTAAVSAYVLTGVNAASIVASNIIV